MPLAFLVYHENGDGEAGCCAAEAELLRNRAAPLVAFPSQVCGSGNQRINSCIFQPQSTNYSISLAMDTDRESEIFSDKVEYL